jgi:uncharacterized repeat protein (TIGR03833 family)
MSGKNRKKITPGMQILIVMKKNQRNGKLTKSAVKDILTKSTTHFRGIKVRLESGEVGRVKEIVRQVSKWLSMRLEYISGCCCLRA